MSHLIHRSKQLFIVGLFTLALVTSFFSSPSPTGTPTNGTNGWTDPIGG